MRNGRSRPGRQMGRCGLQLSVQLRRTQRAAKIHGVGGWQMFGAEHLIPQPGWMAHLSPLWRRAGVKTARNRFGSCPSLAGNLSSGASMGRIREWLNRRMDRKMTARRPQRNSGEGPSRPRRSATRTAIEAQKAAEEPTVEIDGDGATLDSRLNASLNGRSAGRFDGCGSKDNRQRTP
jgi:hypothetical protein